jgi:hypothetical protein
MNGLGALRGAEARSFMASRTYRQPVPYATLRCQYWQEGEGEIWMPHRSSGWLWAGRAVAAGAVIGLGGYLFAAGSARASAIATPVGLVVALAALLAPYLLPVNHSSASPPPAGDGEPPGPEGGIVIIADHGSVAAQRITQVTVNPPPVALPPDADPGSQAGS